MSHIRIFSSEDNRLAVLKATIQEFCQLPNEFQPNSNNYSFLTSFTANSSTAPFFSGTSVGADLFKLLEPYYVQDASPLMRQ